MPRYPRRDESQAILIGTDRYDNYEALSAIENNLNMLRSVLISAKRGGFLPEHCHTIRNPQEPENLAEHITEVARQATDVLMVYCSGHGVIDPANRKLQLALEHTREQNLHYTALSLDLLNGAIKSSPAVMKVLILECCYSGMALAGFAMTDVSTMLQQQAEMRGVYTLTSSARDQVSLAPQGSEFTAFSGVLISLLREPPPDHPAGATLAEIYPILRRELTSQSFPEPQQSIENGTGDLALVGWDDDGDGDYEMPVVLVGPSAEDVPAAPASASDEHELAVMPEVARLLRHVDCVDAKPEPLTPTETDQRLVELLLQAKQIHRDDTADDMPANVLAALGKIVTMMIRIGGNEHPTVLYARDLQGYWLARAGRSGEAKEMFERILRVREKIHGAEHPEVLTTRQNLAHIVGLAGNAAEAARQFQQLAEDRERILGHDHADTQESLDSLAYWAGVSGDHEKAVEIYQELLGERDWQYGATDVRTLDIQEKLAYWAGRAGNAALANRTYEQLIMNWTEVQGPIGQNVKRSTKNRDYWAAKVQDGGNQ